MSEVMLQQTRVAAVIPYYERFLARFPDAKSLAAAREEELLAMWSGLGYYSRARNLQAAARRVAEDGFPLDYEGIRALPGVGPYTAAAVASIAFGLPYGVLDGNVLRVTARLTADGGDIGSAITKNRLQKFVNVSLPPKEPGEFNQALMELGATICLPKAPLCLVCPVRDDCEALKTGQERKLPVKLRKVSPIVEEKTVLLIERKGRLLLRQRPASERRLAGFWELPEESDLPQADGREFAGNFRHSIVEHSYRIAVIRADISHPPRGFSWVSMARLEEMPLTTTARKALRFRTTTTGGGNEK